MALVGGLEAALDVVGLDRRADGVVLADLLLEVAGHGVVGLGVVRLELDAGLERFHRLVEVALLVVEARELQLDVDAVRGDFLGAQQHLLGFFDPASILIQLGHAEVVVHVLRIERHDLLADRLGLVRRVHLLLPVHADQVLEAALLEDRALALREAGSICSKASL